METYTGHVKSPQDAIVLFEACRMGQLPRVQRRLSEKERRLIKSGSVFVWDEREAGMRRWTDGKSWSASRVNGSFLTYREMEGKKGGGSVPSPGSGTGPSAQDEHEGGCAEAPDGYRYRPDGLTKQSFSITTSSGQHLHLISYFSRSDLNSARLMLPSQDPALRTIRPPRGMYPESTFQDASTTPALTRSPMVGAQYASSPQGSPASTPQYAQPRSMPHSYSPAYAWAPSPYQTPPMTMTPAQHYSPYGDARLPGHSPQYGPGPIPAHHARIPPGPTAFDRLPAPLGSSAMPPPPQVGEAQPVHYMNGPPMAPGQHPAQWPIQPLHPLASAHPAPAMPQHGSPVADHIPRKSSHSPPIKQEEPGQAISNSASGGSQTPPRKGAGMIPSIGALINHSPPPSVERYAPPLAQIRTFGSSHIGTSGLPALPEKKPYTEDTRALRQLDKAHRPKSLSLGAGKENDPPTPQAGKPHISTPKSLDRLSKPFKCPGAATVAINRSSDKPARKRRKVSYADADGSREDGDAYSNTDRLALATRDVNRFPVFKPRSKDEAFRQRFAVPFQDKDRVFSAASRPAPVLGMRTGVVLAARPLHDPSGEFAIVLYDPTIDDKPVVAASQDGEKKSQEQDKAVTKLDVPLMHKSLADILGIKKKVEGERKKVAVVIDPRLAKVLRPHQVEGVRFLYRCTTGMIDEQANGCIMADEMGLGKTLQCIALMWTLLKQSPDAGKPTIQKCVIACPSSLVRNWANELVKWLGPDAINPFAIDGKASKEELTQQLRQWCIASGRAVVRPVLIVSYETLRLNVDELKNTPIGLLLCDEGHRLKNGESLTFTSLNSLNVQKRVILSGTPIQNDLSEYFSLLNFANPNLLGTRAEFRKKYELPILRGRDADGSDADRQRGDECLSELLTLVNKFIIRRTNDILSKYLPRKYEHVVFCNMAPFQKDLYKHFINSPDIKSLIRGKGSQPLKAIGLLKKLCNHPDLLDLPSDLPGCEDFFPEDFVPKDARGRDRDVKPWYSGKMLVLDRMLAQIHRETNDKIVLISNYTQTLDVFSALCRQRGYGHLRLDGTMNVTKRQKLVDRFNDPENTQDTVFLLSSKAGGCGINLIGANRLVLFDPDWNPAADQQALARVWRDGQKKDCFVYRLVATGSIEEKIFMRQSHKQSLSSCVVDSAEDVERHFSSESLRELFMLKEGTRSETHDTFKCARCRKSDGRQTAKAPAMLYGDTSTWNHMVGKGPHGYNVNGAKTDGGSAPSSQNGDGRGSASASPTKRDRKGGAAPVAREPEGTLGTIQDLLLRAEVEFDEVSAVFQYISH